MQCEILKEAQMSKHYPGATIRQTNNHAPQALPAPFPSDAHARNCRDKRFDLFTRLLDDGDLKDRR
jgi:hypothetical protein